MTVYNIRCVVERPFRRRVDSSITCAHVFDSVDHMSEEIDKHVLNKYEIQKKLGKGVRGVHHISYCPPKLIC